jgi:hypothetical protein
MEESTRLKLSNNMLHTNQKGFSLISVMVAVGLLGGVSLAVMQLSQNANQVNNMAQIKTDEIELTQSLRMVLNNPTHCQAGILGETFEKKLVDNDGIVITPGSDFQEDDEGLDIELWYGKDGGTVKTHKKFNGFDNPSISPDPEKSKFGKLKIISMKLVMNNGMGSCADNYCPGLGFDTGQLVVLYEKKINKDTIRTQKKIIDLNVGFATVGGISTVLSCSGVSTATTTSVFPPVNCTWTPTITASQPSWAIATCPAGKALKGHSILTSNNVKEDMEIELLPNQIRGRRPSDGTSISVKAYCCDP